MSSREKIDSIYDFTEKGLVELKAWLEPWLTGDEVAASSGGGVVDDDWKFDWANEGGFGNVEFHDSVDFGGYANELGLLLRDWTRKGMMLLALDPDTLSPPPQPTSIKVVEGAITASALTSASGEQATVWDSDGIAHRLTGGSTEFVINLTAAGERVVVNDHSGNPIFRIDENGDLHGKTGKTLTFDL